MKRPLQSLLFTQEHHPNILSGKKTTTIRQDYRDYKAGKSVLLCCNINTFCVMADIIYVKHCKLSELTLDEIRMEGFPDIKTLHEKLLTYYPSLTLDNEITYIEWKNIR